MGADQHLAWEKAAASALTWWRDAGVDVLVDEDPRDWLAPVRAQPAAAPEPAPAQAPASSPPDELDAFLTWRIGDAAPDHVPNMMVAPRLSPGAGLMVVIDMPEADDLATGALMGGPAGRLFDRMLAAIGLDRDKVHLVPLCAARPASGRIAPELEGPLGRVARHLAGLLAPRAVLVLGTAAARSLIGPEISPRGGLHRIDHDGREWPVIATYHPRFLIERPAAKGEAWKHLRLLMKQGMD